MAPWLTIAWSHDSLDVAGILAEDLLPIACGGIDQKSGCRQLGYKMTTAVQASS